MVVEPRTSTNSMVSSISAPPRYSVAKEWQSAQKRGFLRDLCIRIATRNNPPPMPANGLWQLTQRGLDGSLPHRGRKLLQIGLPSVRILRHISSTVLTLNIR